jgi:7-keto-8-aminopelargonate synthetase-like enzyme
MVILSSAVGNYIHSSGKKYSYFGGNNYLGLANHPVITEASIQSIRKYGVNFSASRHTTGTADIHLELEKSLSEFKGREGSVIFASGYQGNSILLDIFKNDYSVILMDQSAHPSITTTIPGNITNIQTYSHCDAEHLEYMLKEHKGSRPLIITDGVFALTGEIAPLDKICPLAEKYGAILIVDDAHSTGILGKNGRGTFEHFNLKIAKNMYQTETMSKALGSYGGFISGDSELINLIRTKSTTYQASTSVPPSIIAAGIASMNIIRTHPDLRTKVLNIAGEVRKRISVMGFQTTLVNTPIISIFLNSHSKAKNLSIFLEKNGIIVPFVNYPVNMDKHIVRITVSANHTIEQTEILLETLNKWRGQNEKL